MKGTQRIVIKKGNTCYDCKNKEKNVDNANQQSGKVPISLYVSFLFLVSVIENCERKEPQETTT
jgi:hypothetical protein